MGYRSNVEVVFYTTNKEQLPMAALKLWFDENYPKKEALGEWAAEIEYGDDHVRVRYDDVKWYNGYTHPVEVNSVCADFHAIFEPETGTPFAHWELVRVGEEVEDIVHDGSSYCEYRLGVSREITFY